MSDEKPPIFMYRRGTMLHPQGALDSETVMNLPAGKPLRVRITNPRNVPQHRLYWAMLALVCDNLDQPLQPEALHAWIKIRLGYSITIPTKSGVEVVPGSIAFDKMGQPEFQAFFRQAVDLVAGQIIPGISKPKLEAEARAMLGEVA